MAQRGWTRLTPESAQSLRVGDRIDVAWDSWFAFDNEIIACEPYVDAETRWVEIIFDGNDSKLYSAYTDSVFTLFRKSGDGEGE